MNAIEEFQENGCTVSICPDAGTYVYTVTDECGETIAEGDGYISLESAMEEAKVSAHIMHEHTVQCNGTLNRETGEVDHSEECPLHDAARTAVIFRKWLSNGDIIALFPYEPGTVGKPEMCSSYEHFGQHGAADLASCIKRTVQATADEYAALKTELESEPYKYKLVRVDRTPRDAHRIRTAKMKRSR